MRADLPTAHDGTPHRTAALRTACLAVALLSSAPATAQDIDVGIDQARLLRLDKPGAEFIVGNPSIADISVQNSRLIVITGKSFGSTNLIVLDRNGGEILNRTMTVQPSKGVVALYKGTSRQSYSCDKQCEPVIMPGDSPAYVEAVAKAIRTKSGLATGSAAGGSAPPE